jgi:TolB-like protein
MFLLSRLKKFPLAAIAAASLFLAGGCSTSTITAGAKPGATLPAPTATMAVVPFENLSNQRHAGLVMTDLATTILHVETGFQIKEISGLSDNEDVRLRRLETDPWERQVGLNTAAAVAVGKEVDVEYVLAGSVGEYGFVDGFGETANVGISLRLVDVGSAQVVWAGTLSRKASSPAFNDESVHRLAHEVMLNLLGQMNKSFAPAK